MLTDAQTSVCPYEINSRLINYSHTRANQSIGYERYLSAISENVVGTFCLLLAANGLELPLNLETLTQGFSFIANNFFL